MKTSIEIEQIIAMTNYPTTNFDWQEFATQNTELFRLRDF